MLVGRKIYIFFLSLIFNFDFAGIRLRMAVGLVAKSGPAKIMRNIKRKVNKSGITSSC